MALGFLALAATAATALEERKGVPFWDQFGDAYEGPLVAPEPWDVLLLNGEPVPGVAEVDCTPKIKIDIPKKSGRDGGPTIDKGHEPARVDIRVTLYTPKQWERFQDILRPLWRRVGEPVPSTRKGIEISHPACAMYGVNAIVIESPESPKRGPVPGSRTVAIKALQYIPPRDKPVTKKAEGAGKRVNLATEYRDSATGIPAKSPALAGVTARRPGG